MINSLRKDQSWESAIECIIILSRVLLNKNMNHSIQKSIKAKNKQIGWRFFTKIKTFIQLA